MSAVSSPSRFSGDYDGFYDPNFTADISNKMRVPRRIRVTGDDEQEANDLYSKPLESEKLQMTVPERILVAGQDHHIGLKSPPRELHLEQSMMPKSSGIRVQTPPRVLTLEDHQFPTVEDVGESENSTAVVVNDTAHNSQTNSALDQSITLSYPPTPPMQDILVSPTEEMMLLRRHIARLSRRVLVLENENQQRQQREMIIYSIGIAYFFLKTLFWLHRQW